MTARTEFIRNCVITTMSDDYENFQIIFRSAQSLAASRGLTVTEDEVVEALTFLISEGLAEAYLLSPHPPHSSKVAFSTEQLHELWFYVTPLGKSRAKPVEDL